MTKAEKNAEHRHVYETRLGIFGLEPKVSPTQDQHNLAVSEAYEHMAALKLQESKDAISSLLKLRDEL